MSVTVRVDVPNLVNARAKFIGQMLHLTQPAVLSCMLLASVQDSLLEDQLDAVRGVLVQFRLSLSEDQYVSPVQED